MSTLKRIWIPLAAVAVALAANVSPAAEMTYSAKMTGASELPEPNASKAEAELKLVVSDDGRKIGYTLTAKDVVNPVGADIHLGPETANGPLVVKLFPAHGATSKKGPFTGVLAEGTITAADLIGPLKGSDLTDLIEQIREGNTYTNIHTNDGVEPANSGPGDMARGEIRGQIK